MIYSYRLEQAIRAAAVLHKDQVRKGSAPFPYITHLFAVAVIVSDYTNDEDTIIAALLHDAIEDTDYTPEELQEDFGGKVRDIVESVTEPTEKGGERISWKQGKKLYIEKLKKASKESLIVVAADKIHNMRSIIEDYYDDVSAFLADFRGTPDDRMVMYQQVSNLLNRELKNDIIHEFNHVFAEYKKFIENAKKKEAGY